MSGAQKRRRTAAGVSVRLWALWALLLALLLLPGCAADGAGAGSSAADAPGGSLSVGFDQDFPPFSFLDSSGEYTGFDIELAKEVCRRNNWTFRPVSMKWDTKNTLLQSGEIDCIWSCFSMTTRTGDYAWSIPYLDNRIVILTAADAEIKTLADLAGKRVYVESSTSQAQQITHEFRALEQTFAELYMVDDYSVVLLYLRTGKADALIFDSAAAGYYIAQYPGQFRILEEALSDDQCGVAFRLGDERRAAEVSQTLRDMARDGSLATLAAAWGMQDSLCVDDQ